MDGQTDPKLKARLKAAEALVASQAATIAAHTATLTTAATVASVTAVQANVTAMQLSGTTASRPTTGNYVGRPYADTTLGYTVTWKTGTTWVNGTGATV